MNKKTEIINFSGHAAILLAVSGSGREQRLLLTKRAQHLNIHRGEVAFPGGKWEEDDKNLLVTALRESHEEVDLAPEQVHIIGELPTCYTRSGIPVTPFVAQVSENLQLNANPAELDAIFWVPVDFFVSDRRHRTDIFYQQRGEDWAPVYYYQGFKIWGFTARVIISFVNQFCGVKIGRNNAAREVVFKKRD